MREDLVSVIVPVYNVENYLRECLDSIVAQTYRNIEVILIDDGSKDSSGKICDEYADKDNRVKVIHKENGGLSEARNSGLEIASGVWIAFVDSDDYIDEAMLGTLVDLANNNNAQVAMCTFRATSMPLDNNSALVTRVFNRDELLEVYIKRAQEYSITNSVWDRIYKKELVKGIRFAPRRLNEDILYTMQVFLRADTVVYTSAKLYHYRDIREGNISGVKVSLKSINDKIYLTGLAAKELRTSGYGELADIYESLNFLEIAGLVADSEYRTNGDLREYRAYIKKIIRNMSFKSSLQTKTKIRIWTAYNFPKLEKNISKIYSKLIKKEGI